MTSTRKANVAPIYFEPGDTITCKPAAAVTGSRFVKATAGGLGNRPAVTPGTAGGPAFGVAQYDAASTDLGVPVLRRGCVGVTAGEQLSAGNTVSVGADGKAVKATAGSVVDGAYTAPSVVVGTCVADTANGQLAPITLAL